MIAGKANVLLDLQRPISRRHRCYLLFSVAYFTVIGCTSAPGRVSSVGVEGTQFRVHFSNGVEFTSSQLLGAELTIASKPSSLSVRIESVRAAPGGDGIVWLHVISIRSPSGSWVNPCQPDSQGRRESFPLGNVVSSADGALHRGSANAIEIVCTSGARGKCVLMGYVPWKGPRSMDFFNACSRMVRADYGGTGTSYTQPGKPILPYDDSGIRARGVPGPLKFEAGWTPSGAVCVRHVRVDALVSLDALVTRYPKLRGQVGEACDEGRARSLGALVFNQSY